MKKNIFLLLSACLLSMGQAKADNVLIVGDVNVPQGSQATIEIGCEFGTEYTGFQLELSLPSGLSLQVDDGGYPEIEKAFDTNHVLTGNLLPSNGNYRFTCRSMDNVSMPTSGTLFRVTVVADASLALGTSLPATITACEFTRTADSQGEDLADVDFTVNITEFRTILDETSSTAPEAATDVNVRVKRTIKAGEWSTICLPFAMTSEQCKTAFGDDVQLADFTGCDLDDETGDIKVKFTSTTAIEANHPYIIKVTAAVSEFTIDNVDIAPEEEPVIDKDEVTTGTGRNKVTTYNSFIGNYVNGTDVPNYAIFLYDNKFYFSTGETRIKAFRAYFDFASAGAEYPSESRHFSLSFDDATTISDATRLMDSGEVYNLSGQRVSKPSKGVFISNGKKVYVK